MIDIALQKPVDQTQLKRFAHGGGALILSLGLLLLLALAAEAMIGPKLDLLASLNARAESIEALETALINEQAALSSNLQLIGAKSDDGTTALSSTQIHETLAIDADVLTGELEAFGFALNNRSEPTERPVTPSLVVYAITLSFAGDTDATAALMSAPIVSDAHISSINLTTEGASAGGQGINLTLDIQRIGASAVQENGDGGE